MKIQLTKKLVMGAKPAPKPYELRDVLIKGLLLRVHPSGHRAWVVEWARGRRKTLGAFSELTLEDARTVAASAMAEALKHGAPGLAKPKPQEITLQAFLSEHYGPWASTQLKWGRGVVDRLETGFSSLLERRLLELDQWLIDRWWNERLTLVSVKTKRPVGKVTATREIAALRSALNKAIEWGFLETNPLARLRQRAVEARKVVRYLSADEEVRLRRALHDRDIRLVGGRASGNQWRIARGHPPLPAIDPDGFGDHLTPVVLLAMNTGLRRGELLSLHWTDIDFAACLLTVRAETAKSGRSRHLPLNSEAKDVLQRWQRQSGEGLEIFTVADVKTAWGALLASADITKFRFHDLRHHFASKLVMRGVDLNSIRELLGHADLKMTLRYAHLAPAHLASAVAKLIESY
ncbi:MAG TPA: site-specific integrase [Rhodanobacter sp.]|nr:site-specific integrase [Rhodanobacter sp.]